jgi:hypothetical protein
MGSRRFVFFGIISFSMASVKLPMVKLMVNLTTAKSQQRIGTSVANMRQPKLMTCFLATIFALLALCSPISIRAQEAAVVTFTLDFPGSEPSHYVISVSSDGHSTYESDGKLSPDSDADPFHLSFLVSPATSTTIFDLAKRAHYFQGQIDSGKRKLASTGAKTLTYKDASQNATATYNYSPIQAVQQVTQLFQNLSTTLEFGRRLQYYHRYQKLALDEELKRMEDMANENSLQDLPAVVPILQQIVTDNTVINPVRARAQRMVEKAESVKP